MNYKLTNLLQDVYGELGQLRNAVATDGSESTLVDARLAGQHADDEWKRGLLFVTRAGRRQKASLRRWPDLWLAAGRSTFRQA